MFTLVASENRTRVPYSGSKCPHSLGFVVWKMTSILAIDLDYISLFCALNVLILILGAKGLAKVKTFFYRILSFCCLTVFLLRSQKGTFRLLYLQQTHRLEKKILEVNYG